MVETLLVGWLVLGALVAAGWALVARGALREDQQNGWDDTAELDARDAHDGAPVPAPRAPIG